MKPILLIILLATSLAAKNEYLQQAEEYIAREEYDRAYIAISNAKNHSFNYQDLFQVGILYCKIGAITDAIETYRRVLEQAPSSLPTLYNIAFALKVGGYADEALEIYRVIVARDPSYEPARMGLAFTLLQKGDYVAGWTEHEWNLKKQGKNADALRTLLRENKVKGKIILLTPEGGIGDSIQFVRYAERLKNMGARVAVAIQKPLVALFQKCPYIDFVYAAQTGAPRHDARATLMSLPAFFYDSKDTIPHTIPYLFPDQDLIAYWEKQLEHDHNFKIGICWQVDVHNDVSRLPIAHRGIPLAHFFTLKNIPGITFYSLQKHEGLDQLEHRPTDFNLVIPENFDEEHGPFMDTAALMQHMDLIISVDTAVAHLAGALGRPTWLLLPYNADWRWLFGRTDSPWYPNTRIFQQPKPFDWQFVMDTVKTTLEQLCKK
jgi:tetratricopeptide (TPR) repeat protein